MIASVITSKRIETRALRPAVSSCPRTCPNSRSLGLRRYPRFRSCLCVLGQRTKFCRCDKWCTFRRSYRWDCMSIGAAPRNHLKADGKRIPHYTDYTGRSEQMSISIDKRSTLGIDESPAASDLDGRRSMNACWPKSKSRWIRGEHSSAEGTRPASPFRIRLLTKCSCT
jgi:hypothetical protein